MPIGREKLAGLLWPEHPERNARHSLNQALFDLRRVTGDRHAAPSFLLITRQTLQFNPQSDHWLDVTAFVERLDACEAHPHRRLATCDVCNERLRKAVSLYRGDFLEGFSLPDSAAFEEWALLERERLQRLAVDTLRRVAECHERRGEYEEALGYTRRWLELEPWQEEAHRWLMRVLALSGQRNAALAQYEACRSVLGEELGVEPGQEIATLYERIRDGTELDDLSRTAPHNLPAQLTPFVGRETELTEIEACLRDPDCRLLTLVGPGGSGKTRLAIEAGVDLLDDFEDGAFLVPLAALQSVDAIVPTVAQALSLSFHGGSELLRQLLNHLSRKSLLLILDNFEHFISSGPVLRPNRTSAVQQACLELAEGACPGLVERTADREGVKLVLDILRATQSVKILITSRARLNVQSEQVFPVRGMDYPVDVTSAPSPKVETAEALDARRYSAVELFLQSARRARPDFEPDAGDLTRVAGSCRLVQGMPLGILLSAAWLPVLSPAEIAAQLGQSFDFLEANLRDLPQRQRSMRAVFDRSWHLLREREQEVFASLSVFHGGFTYQAALEVTGTSLRELMMLVNRSLLHCTPAGRYEVHELLRQYAEEKLELSSADSKSIHDRHCAYYIAALEQWGIDLKGARQPTASAEMDVEIENARGAWNWAVEQVQVKRLDRAIFGLCQYYTLRGRLQECKTACGAAAMQLEGTGSDQQTRTLARVLMWQGDATFGLGQYERGQQLVQRSLALLDDPVLAGQHTRAERAAILRHVSGMKFFTKGAQSGKLDEERLTLYQELGDRLGVAGVLGELAERAFWRGELSEAKEQLEQNLVLWQELGDQRGIEGTYRMLGNVAREHGELGEAESLYLKAAKILRETQQPGAVRWTQWHQSLTLMLAGRFTQAKGLMEESRAQFGHLGDKDIADNHAVLGFAEMHIGDYERARVQGETSLALARRARNRWSIPFSLRVLGCVALAEAVSGRDAETATRAQNANKAR